MQFIHLNIFASSAYNNILEYWIQSIRSLMKIKNKIGPRMLFWGTPLVQGSHRDIKFLISIR